jgi:hypothetical protein
MVLPCPKGDPADDAAPAPQPPAADRLAYAAPVHPAFDLRVDSGANAGDPLPSPAESICGDYYRLTDGARPLTLRLALDVDRGAGRVAPGSDLGRPGDAVTLLGRLSLMAPDGDLIEVLVLDLLDSEPGPTRLALPLTPLRTGRLYALIAADARPGPIRLADAMAGAFAQGTRVLLADGTQVPVDRLEPGAAVLTRDHGAQILRWRGTVRLRAEGGQAPVVIDAGVMGNPHPLVVSPHHRMFLYRREARAQAGAAELLVQARHLVDGRRIRRREGGHVVYHGLVFDRHEVIYAEGVPCESLMVCPETLTRLPDDLAAPLRAAFPGLSQSRHAGAEPPAELVSHLGPLWISDKGAQA